MKTTIFFTSIILISFSSIGQSRVDNWQVEKFSSVSIETQLKDLGSKSFTSSDPEIINMVYDHLQRIELKPPYQTTNAVTQNIDGWNFIIKFKDWQDEFRIYNSQAMVGKSTFEIGNDVSAKFAEFYKGLIVGK